MNARILLLKGVSERHVSEYSDFQRYTVESTVKTIGQDAPQD